MITFALVPVRSRVLGAKLIASILLAVAMLVMAVGVAAAGVLLASPGVDGTWTNVAPLIAQSAVYLTAGMVTGVAFGAVAARLDARHRRALHAADRLDGARVAVRVRRRRPVAGHAPGPRPAAPGGPDRHPVGACRHCARPLDAASSADRHLADHAREVAA